MGVLLSVGQVANAGSMGFRYIGDLDPEVAGVYHIIGVEFSYETGWCSVDTEKLEPEQIGAWEEYEDGHVYVIPPRSPTAIPLDEWERQTECAHFSS